MTVRYGIERYEELAKLFHTAKGPTGDTGYSQPGYEVLALSYDTISVGAVDQTICSYAFGANEFTDNDFLEIELSVASGWDELTAYIRINGIIVGQYTNDIGSTFVNQRATICKIGNDAVVTISGNTTTALGDWMASSGTISISLSNIGGNPSVTAPYVTRISRIW